MLCGSPHSYRSKERKRRKEKSGHDVMKVIGDVHSLGTIWRKESICQQQKIVQNAMEPTTIAAHPRGFASMTESL
jgi:hypothetical protein